MLDHLLSDYDGVARTRVLQDRGISRTLLAKTLHDGRLIRVKHGWVASRDADPALVFAARFGLTLSCVTQARRLGIWTRERDPRHFAVPRPGAEIRPDGATLHYHRPPIPREPYALVDRIENLLWIVAHCQPHEDAVAAWDSALNQKLVTRAALERLPLDAAAGRVFEETDPFADSGLESYVRLRLRRFRLRIAWQPWVHGHHVDFLIGERLVLQIDGGEHIGRQRTQDTEHDSLLMRRGYFVMRIGYEAVMYRWAEVQAAILEAVAQGLHPAR